MNKITVILLSFILIISAIFFWWFGPRQSNLIKQCHEEIFNGDWKVGGEDERIDPLEKLRTMQKACLMEKGIK